MAKFPRHQVINKLYEARIVPVFYHTEVEIACRAIKALADGGMQVVEFVNRTDNAHTVFTEIITYVRKHLPDLIVGAGTIVDAGTASLYVQAGADFIVSPSLLPDVASTCHRRKILYIPGCGSLTEIANAESQGAEFIKLFPGSHFKPEFVKAIKAPCPWTSIVVTGGVQPTEHSLGEWFDAGVSCVGMGSQLVSQQQLDTEDYLSITAKAKFCTQFVQSYTNSNK